MSRQTPADAPFCRHVQRVAEAFSQSERAGGINFGSWEGLKKKRKKRRGGGDEGLLVEG